VKYWPAPDLNVFCVLLEESFVDVTFDVGVENGPGFFVDEVGDEAFEFGGVLDFVLGLAEDGPEHAGFLYVVRARTGRATRPVRFAEVFEGAAVMDFEGNAVELDEGGPGVVGGDYGRVVPGRKGSLVGHFEEEEEGELFDVIAV